MVIKIMWIYKRLRGFVIGFLIFVNFCVDPYLYLDAKKYCKKIKSTVWKEWKRITFR